MRTYETAQTNLGPFSPFLPGIMRLELNTRGNLIMSAAIERGYLHKGIEKLFEKHFWQVGIHLADHLDPEAAIFSEIVYCSSVENLFKVEVPLRAKMVRTILAEMSRISSHLRYMVTVARMVSSPSLVHYLLRDREKILDVFELLSGARFAVNYLRFGGVKYDVTDGFLERVLDVTEYIQGRLREYQDMLVFHQFFIDQTKNIGCLSYEDCVRYSVSGPNARASGVAIDLRSSCPYLAYEAFDAEVTNGSELGGDTHGRVLIRLLEIDQSTHLIRSLINNIKPGEYREGDILRLLQKDIPKGNSYVEIEGPRGILGCYVASDGSSYPRRVQFRVPSVNLFELIPDWLKGQSLDDFALNLASLDVSVSEADL